MSTPERDTMRLRNRTVIAVIACSVLAAAVFVRGWDRLQAQGSQQPQTTLPKDVDPSDPAIPTWMRPATPAHPPTASSTPAPNPATKTPPGTPPGQPQP